MIKCFCNGELLIPIHRIEDSRPAEITNNSGSRIRIASIVVVESRIAGIARIINSKTKILGLLGFADSTFSIGSSTKMANL